jgi:16S rRNA processing protein RimM
VTRPAPRHLVVGRIGRPHGVRGELEVDVWTDFPERFRPGSRLLVGQPEEAAPRPVTVASSRAHHARLLVRLDVAADRDEAALLTGQYFLVPLDEAMPLDEDTYYHHQLVGLAVQLAEGGQPLGTVVEVIETGSADVIVVRGERGEVLLPLLGEVVQAVDLAAGRMLVVPPPGLLPDDGA